MKHLNYLWLAGFACLASCSSDEYLGEQEGLAQNGGAQQIGFSMKMPNITRTTPEGLQLYANNFVVYGTKTPVSPATVNNTVFPHYAVWYNGSNGSTSTNTAGWEYSGASFNIYTKLANDATFNSGTTYYKNTAGAYTEETVADDTEFGTKKSYLYTATPQTLTPVQTAKYWDNSAAAYNFFAVAPYDVLAGGTNITEGTGTYPNVSASATTKTITANDAAGVFIADRTQVVRQSGGYPTNSPVTLQFRRLNAQVRLGFYETIPGYDVTAMEFYYLNDATGTATGTPQSAVKETALPNPGVDIEGYPTSGAYQIDWNATTGVASTTLQSGGNTAKSLISGTGLNFGSKKMAAPHADVPCLGYNSTEATYTNANTNGWVSVLPNEANTATMNLMVNYTLTSVDGTETIKVYGAKAVVPADYLKWKPNYAYTYLFKISDNSNGGTSTTPGDPTGLYPITFDAVVADVMDGVTQETITTVATPSITTYAEGSDVTNNNEYTSSDNIVLSVEDIPSGWAIATTDPWHYKVVDNAITEQEAALIASDDSGWNSITKNSNNKYIINTPTAGKYYIVRLTYTDSSSNTKYAYKVIKIKAA